MDQVAGSSARDTASVACVLLSAVGTYVLSTAVSACSLEEFTSGRDVLKQNFALSAAIARPAKLFASLYCLVHWM